MIKAILCRFLQMGRENMRKFEKFMSDKDRMLKQVKEDSEKDIKVLHLEVYVFCMISNNCCD